MGPGGPDQGLGADLALPPEGTNAATTEFDDGSVEVDLNPDQAEELNVSEKFDDNLAEFLSEDVLQAIGRKVVEWVDQDDLSRKDWKKTYTDGLELLGFKSEDRSDPWQGACGVFHPVMTESLVRFQSQAIIEIFPASGPVKTKILGKWTREKEQQAQRVQEELNHYVTDKMTEFRPETETLLFYLALAGFAARKSYYDPILRRPTALFVPAEDFIVPYGTSDLRTAPRYTHLMRMFLNDIRKDTAAGFYREVALNKPTVDVTDIQTKKNEMEGRQPTFDMDERYVVYECHCNFDIEGYEDKKIEEETGAEVTTGIELPYVVTVERDSRKVLAIRRNWKEVDPLKQRVQHFTAYHYLPGLGFYGSGLIHLIGGITKSATSILRQLVDAGTLNNLPGGLKARGLRIKGDDTPIMPGEFRDVDVPSGTIRDNITFLPYKEPSQTLYQLLGNIIEEGRRLGAAPDLPVNAMSQQAPVGTTLALLERSMKIMSAVQARLHASLKQDYCRIADLIADNEGDKYEYEVDDPTANRIEDFSVVDIVPVSDPNASSTAQRVMQFQAAIELARQSPTSFDLPELYRGALTALAIPNVNKVVKDPEDIKPMDPISENMAIITGKPVKAAIWQEHEAHIRAHMAASQDPKILQLVGQSPQATTIQAAMAAHVQEHVAYQYRREIEKQMGVPLPMEGEPLPPEVEIQLSKLAADAADRVLKKDQAEAQQQKIQQQQQDPVIQMQQQELAIKQQEVQRKAQADKLKLAMQAAGLLQKNEAEVRRLQSQERVAGAALGVKIATTHDANDKDKRETVIDSALELADLQQRAQELQSRERIAKEQVRNKGKTH